ncbi:FAD-dependent monooxygenase [Streptomyces sp. DW26H14]|uniref:FAD-dependent monooxygenase n=1 Tax=Streptomyces sp. DW26H14 TaxID=3435395 RepID=UPI00403D78C4
MSPDTTANPIRRVLVSGAAAAGETLAFWLHRRGFDVTVVEKWSAPRSGGFAVDLRGAAITVAERMGLLPRFTERSVPMKEVANFDAAGEVVWRAEGNYAHTDGDLEILRDDLTEILCSTNSGIRHIWGDSIASLAETDGGVRVGFERAEPELFDLVVGADGLHSNVRALAFGPEERFGKHLGYYTAVFEAPDVVDMDSQMWLCTIPGAMASLVQWGPEAGTRGSFIVAAPHVRALGRAGRADQMRLVDECLGASDAWHVPALLRAMRASEDFYFDEVTQIHMPRWSTGRVALVGDAAYAPTLMSGQGTSVAVVGAYVLAAELAAADGDHGRAFHRYEQRVRPFVERNQQLANTAEEARIPATQQDLDERNAMIRSAMNSTSDHLDDVTADAANAIDLSVYTAA